MRPTAHISGITRHSTGLTEAHKDFIRLLARIAVERYISETESAAEPERRDKVAQ